MNITNKQVVSRDIYTISPEDGPSFDVCKQDLESEVNTLTDSKTKTEKELLAIQVEVATIPALELELESIEDEELVKNAKKNLSKIKARSNLLVMCRNKLDAINGRMEYNLNLLSMIHDYE